MLLCLGSRKPRQHSLSTPLPPGDYASPVFAIAALSGPLPKLGVVVAALLAGWAILATDHQPRAWAMLGSLVLAPVLLLADIWNSPQLRIVHRHPAEALIAAAAALIVLIVVAALLARHPRWLAPVARRGNVEAISLETG